jgi:hypothetical protein
MPSTYLPQDHYATDAVYNFDDSYCSFCVGVNLHSHFSRDPIVVERKMRFCDCASCVHCERPYLRIPEGSRVILNQFECCDCNISSHNYLCDNGRLRVERNFYAETAFSWILLTRLDLCDENCCP